MMNRGDAAQKVEKVKNITKRALEMVSEGLWVIATVGLTVVYPFALGIIEDRFLNKAMNKA